MSDDSEQKLVEKNAGKAKVSLPWSPWLAVVIVVVVYFVAQFAGGFIVSIIAGLTHGSSANDWLKNSTLAQFIYVLLAEALTLWLLWLFMRSRRRNFTVIGLTRPQWIDIGYTIGGVAIYYLMYLILISVLSALIPELNVDQKQQLGFDHVKGVVPLVLTFISLVILPPFVEEIMFRGFLFTSLKKAMPVIAAALITSGIFAIAHLEIGNGGPLVWVAAIDTFILSLMLVYLRQKTGRLYASMGAHSLKNLVAFLLLFIFHVH